MCTEIKLKSGETGVRRPLVTSDRSKSRVRMNYGLLKWFQFPLFPPRSCSSQWESAPHSPSRDKRWKGCGGWEGWECGGGGGGMKVEVN